MSGKTGVQRGEGEAAFTSRTDFIAATATMAGKRVLADMDPDYEDITKDQAKRQRIIEEDGKLMKYLDQEIQNSVCFLEGIFSV